MKKSLAVAIIHGIGSAEPGFSAELQRKLERHLGSALFDRIACEEIVWADILRTRQQKYLDRIKDRTRYDGIREFVLNNLSDAVAYRKTRDDTDKTYLKIHARVARAIKRLESRVSTDAALVVLAHSLGGHVMSNYIWDVQSRPPPGSTDFEKLRRMAGFVTFGCNIPLFVFSYPASDVKPIAYPGTKLPTEMRIKPWWLNFYDPDDILGFPLAEIGPRYQALATQGELDETSINVGRALQGWNPLSHNEYWRDDDLSEPLAGFLRRLL